MFQSKVRVYSQLVLGKYYGECTETPRWKRGHFGSENSNILPLLFHPAQPAQGGVSWGSLSWRVWIVILS